MKIEYLESIELYKGYKIELKKVKFENTKSGYHKRITVYNSEGKSISAPKSKKEAKELIDLGYIEF